MKTEELDKIKKSLEEHGFEYIITDSNNDQVLMIIQKKDPWEGVEFVECKWSTLIYRAQDVELGKDFKPSTESAYIEQLKQQAFERFGEINVGDRFEREYCELNPISKIRSEFEPVFRYYKDSDALTFQGTGIYKQGQWATKIQRIEVTKSINFHNCYTDDHHFAFHLSKQIENASDVHSFLTEELTKYLNERRD